MTTPRHDIPALPHSPGHDFLYTRESRRWPTMAPMPRRRHPLVRSFFSVKIGSCASVSQPSCSTPEAPQAAGPRGPRRGVQGLPRLGSYHRQAERRASSACRLPAQPGGPGVGGHQSTAPSVRARREPHESRWYPLTLANRRGDSETLLSLRGQFLTPAERFLKC